MASVQIEDPGGVMRILLVNHYAGSPLYGMEYRPYYLAREWVRLGHSVTVVGSSFSHLRRRSPEKSEEMIDDIRFLWLKTRGYNGNGAGRVLNMAAFSTALYLSAGLLARNERPDVVIASSPHPFIIYGAGRIARLSGARLIFEVRDLWPLTIVELGNISPRHPFIALMQRAEDYAYRAADRVISVLPKAGDYMVGRGMNRDKFACVPNGVDIAGENVFGLRLPNYHEAALAGLREKGLFLVGYAGGHGIANALGYLIDAAAILRNSPVAFVLAGEGTEKQALAEKAMRLGLENVCLLPPVDKAAMPALLSAMDALYIGWNREPIYRFGISPNKIMDYMMSGKPVIHSVEACNDPVAESGCGVSVPPEDPGRIAGALESMLSMTGAEREQMGARGRSFVLEHFDYRVLAGKYLEAFR